ncbi:unnamed protein product [Cercospora beticola]|nr:unnamed protein product [Cercospora beticola]
MAVFRGVTAAFTTFTIVQAASQNAIGSAGYSTIDTPGFTLELDVANQVATKLTAKSGSNAGNAPFNFLLSTANRTDDGYYALGDIQIRMRPENSDSWIDVASHFARQPINNSTDSANGSLSSADITASLGDNLPITVVRSWSADQDSVILSFTISNTGNDTLQMGGVGIPTPYNNNWIGKNQEQTWTESVVSDPALSLDAGYVVTNRLTGEGPSLITTPVGKSPLEQYRLDYVSEPNYPEQWLDKTNLDYNYEGVFSWWVATSGLTELDTAAANSLGFTRGSDFNVPTEFSLRPSESRTIGLRFHTSAGPSSVEDRLRAFDRPTIVGVPGFVASSGEPVKMVIRSSSAPTISDVSPANIAFEAVQNVGEGVYAISGTAQAGTFGQTRVTIGFANGEVATAHYSIINPETTQMDNLGAFRFSKQWFSNESDYFGRGPGIITYDNKKQQQVVDDSRAWIAGLSDEAGTGAYVSATAKQLSRPNRAEIAMLEEFATTTLWNRIQISAPGDTYGGVKKSLFYYDAALEGRGLYLPGVDHSGTWPKTEADLLSRSYNYPHPCVVYYTLYRLARNTENLTSVPWTWALDRAYDTIMSMQRNAGVTAYAQFGLMEGSYFLEILRAHKAEGATNSTLSSRATDIENFMRQRTDIWQSEPYPYASEFPWDNTGQEEVYIWSAYFGFNDTATATIGTLLAVMASVPHWGYSGSGAQSAYALIEEFQRHPNDVWMLRAAWGGIVGPLTTIGQDGFGATGFHSRPDYLAWDPYSGDNGVTMAMHALSTRAVIVQDDSLGGWAEFGARVSQEGNVVVIEPTDSARQKVFIADSALSLELDAGHFAAVRYDLGSRSVEVEFEANGEGFTPNARLKWKTTAQTTNSGNYQIVDGQYEEERGATVVPLSGDGTTKVTLRQQ